MKSCVNVNGSEDDELKRLWCSLSYFPGDPSILQVAMRQKTQ